MEKGTLYQIRNLIDRRNITNKPKDIVNAAEDFVELVTVSHILTAAMSYLGMTAVNDLPSATAVPREAWMEDDDHRRRILQSISAKIVDKYVDLATVYKPQESTTTQSTTARSTTTRSTTARSTTAQSTTARSTTAQSTTAQSTTAQSTTAQITTSQSTTAQSTTSQSTTARSTTSQQSVTPSQQGTVYSYACEVLSLGLHFLNFKDAALLKTGCAGNTPTKVFQLHWCYRYTPGVYS